MRFGFVTCVRLGLACMEAIYSVGGSLELVMTLNDDIGNSKSGRIYPDEFCQSRGIELIKIRHINDAEPLSTLEARQLDWLFIIGWSQIAGPEVLRLPSRAVLGMHPTLLPEGRGRAPIPWAIIKGLDETGVTLFELDEGVDTGPIIGQHRLPLSPRETATSLYSRVTDAHRILIQENWHGLKSGDVEASPQDESKATVWPGRRPDDGRIASHMAVAEIDRLVRGATHPYPGAFWDAGDRILRVWAGSTDDDGGIRMPAANGWFYATDYTWEDRID